MLAVVGHLILYIIYLSRKTVPVERMGKDILDMSQYFKVLGTCRIPGVTRDTIQFYGQSSDPPKHIVVAHNNHVSTKNMWLFSSIVLYSTVISVCKHVSY